MQEALITMLVKVRAVLVIATFVFLSTTAPVQVSAQSGQRATIRVGYIPIAECAHIYVAITNKYFEEEGLSVELQAMRGGANILPALQTGDLDVGFSNVVSLALLDSRLPPTDKEFLLSFAGGTYEGNGFTNHALLTRPGAGLRVQDFSRPGLRVALNTQHNIEELILREYLRKHKIQTPDLNIVQLGFPEMLQALDKGSVDVISEVEPFIQPAIRARRAVLIAKQYQDVNQHTLVATYVVSNSWLQSHRAQSQKFRRAIDKADSFIRQNNAQTRQIIGEFTRIAPADLAVMGLPEFRPRVDERSLAEIVAEMKRQSFITAAPTARSMIVP